MNKKQFKEIKERLNNNMISDDNSVFFSSQAFHDSHNKLIQVYFELCTRGHIVRNTYKFDLTSEEHLDEFVHNKAMIIDRFKSVFNILSNDTHIVRGLIKHKFLEHAGIREEMYTLVEESKMTGVL